MSFSDYADPRDHPDNAHLPNVNKPATILGVTISMLVSNRAHAIVSLRPPLTDLM